MRIDIKAAPPVTVEVDPGDLIICEGGAMLIVGKETGTETIYVDAHAGVVSGIFSRRLEHWVGQELDGYGKVQEIVKRKDLILMRYNPVHWDPQEAPNEDPTEITVDNVHQIVPHEEDAVDTEEEIMSFEAFVDDLNKSGEYNCHCNATDSPPCGACESIGEKYNEYLVEKGVTTG